MKKKISFKQFEISFMKAMKPEIVKVFEGEQGSELKVNLGRFLIGGEKMQPQHRNLTAADKYKWLLLIGFTEISESFYTLRDLEILVRSITLRRSKITKARVLSYHVHNYLNENYILKSRLERYPVTILRASKRWMKDQHMIAPFREAISVVFGNIVAIRGNHVHDKRYTDDDLDRLSMLERISGSDSTSLAEPFIQLFKADFAVCRGRWLDRIRTNNNVIEKFLDIYFTTLYPFIFDDDGKFIIPTKLVST
jgi:hypothetical protein